MSVINKMLRDLDQRQVPDDNGAAKPGATPLRSGTASVPGLLIPTRAPQGKGVAVQAGLALAVLAACGGAGWWWMHQAPAAVPSIAAAPVTPSASAPTEAAVPAAAASVAAAASALPPISTASKPVSVASAQVPNVPKPVLATPVATLPVSAPAASVVTSPQTPQQSVAPAQPAVADTVSTGQRQQQAARDALAQAQGLWNAGAHDNAIDLLQQAVATAERSAHSTPGAPATQALTSLARELARMQVAQGRPGASVDMLARLEPLLGGDADIWAVRANAAQRAGRHQDSVNAYTTALQSRPNEQRWLLGAAVSSAALGQTSNAAAFADKAAAVGPIAKDVQAYLRQMGVPLKD